MELYFQWLARQVLPLASSGDLSRWPASAVGIPQKPVQSSPSHIKVTFNGKFLPYRSTKPGCVRDAGGQGINVGPQLAVLQRKAKLGKSRPRAETSRTGFMPQQEQWTFPRTCLSNWI
jgi:hypothetical protein